MSSNKTLAKNTLFLYLRMFFNMGISLYTSRIVLQVLGIENYGIYNLVAGVAVMFAFINNSLTSSTQRFLNIERTSSDVNGINKIFNLSLINHLVISIIVLLCTEVFGYYMLNFKLNISSDKLIPANWVFQCTTAAIFFGMLRLPFYAVIIAYERMSIYAFLGVVETLIKLLIVVLLNYIKFDVNILISYVLLLLFFDLALGIFVVCYVKKLFPDQTKFAWFTDKGKTKEMMFFSSWILFGHAAVVASNQGLNMVFNIFNGVVINAALGIANQVNQAIYSFVSNFQTALNPQIVQSYSKGELDRNRSLVLGGSKYSFFLLSILSAPVFYFAHTLLTIWLGNDLPEYVEQFIKLVVFCSLIDALAGPFWMSATAIGSIKKYNITLTVINACTLPLAYFLLRNGYSPVLAFSIKLLTSIFMQFFRVYFINSFLKFAFKPFMSYLLNILVVFVFLIGLIYLSDNSIKYSIFRVVLGCFLIEFFLLLLIYGFGLTKIERNFVFNKIGKFRDKLWR